MFDNSPMFTILNGAARIMIISRALESKMVNIDKLPILRLRYKDFTWDTFKINVVVDLHPVWRRSLSSDQISMLEIEILNVIQLKYPDIQPCNVSGLKNYITK